MVIKQSYCILLISATNIWKLIFCFLILSEIRKGLENIQYFIRGHVASLEHCFKCKHSPVNSLHPLINFIWMMDVTRFKSRLCLFDFNVL